jgi:hypothetical protein
MLSEDVAEYRRLLEDFHEQIAAYDAHGARVTDVWVQELNDPAFPRHLLAEHTVKVGKISSSLAILALERGVERPQPETRERLESIQAALGRVIYRLQEGLRTTEYVLADSGIQALVGEFLSSVEFVMDYVQLRFCGATLTAFSCPDVQTPHRIFLPSSYGYRDALCNLIGANVESIEVREGAHIRICFTEDRSVTVQIDPGTGRERANFWSTSNRLWSW